MGRIRARIANADLAGVLITLADGTEAVLRFALRWSRHALFSAGLRATRGLVWRGVAALTGIGMTAALVTGLSSTSGEAQLASQTIVPPAADARPVRDVRQEPRQASLGDEGWVRISRPIAMFGLEAAELERQTPVYEARRSQDGQTRQDILSFGTLDEAKPHLVLRMSQDREGASSQPFIIALVRMAAVQGLSVQRSGAPTLMDSKFGPVETTDATFSDGQTSRACIGFRHLARDGAQASPLSLGGWWCGGASRPADRRQLTCLLDRVDLLSAGEDPGLRSLFARTELARQASCSPPRLSAAGRKASWLDADAKAPALKMAARR